jgi:dienelactone hydrolase
MLRRIKRFVAGNRWKLIVILGLLLPHVAVYIAGEWYRTRDYSERFVDMHGRLVEADVNFVEEADGHRLFEVRLKNDGDIVITGFLKVPADAGGRCPALLILGGVRTGKRTLDYIHTTKGVVLLALDYPYQGKKSGLSVSEFLVAVPGIRNAVVRTVPAAMLAVDYLLTRKDVDPERIVLVGGSVGAVFTPAVAAVDRRIAGAAMLFGAGDIEDLIRVNIDAPGVVAAPAAWMCGVLTSPVEPIKYVDEISPRPVFMLNGTGDPRMPERCSRALHDAARDPKTIRWIDAGHVNIRAAEFHAQVSRELVEWLVANELIDPDNFRVPD